MEAVTYKVEMKVAAPWKFIVLISPVTPVRVLKIIAGLFKNKRAYTLYIDDRLIEKRTIGDLLKQCEE